jgi:hypothetical protein
VVSADVFTHPDAARRRAVLLSGHPHDDRPAALARKARLRDLSPRWRLVPWAVLAAIVLLSAAMFEPTYCAWLCPFKAVTEFAEVNSLETAVQTGIFLTLFVGLVVVLPVLTKKRTQCAFFCPFGAFQSLFNKVNVFDIRIDRSYSGGDPLRTIDQGGYRVVVHQPVWRRWPLERRDSFVQLTWRPVSAVPARISDEIDLDGDGKPDLRAAFDVPRDPNAGLRVDVTPLTPRVEPMTGVGKQSLSCLIARVNDSIVLRVPLRSR